MSPTPQTPPTDRPLTAGDVPLLREGELERALREARTTLAMLRRNVATEIKNHDGLFRWEGVPEAIDSRISDIDRVLTTQREPI